MKNSIKVRIYGEWVTNENQNKDLKLKAIYYFLNVILNPEYPLDIRKKEMIRVASKLKGFPEWSDLWGNVLRPIDDCSLSELRVLVEKINDEYEQKLLEELQINTK